MPDNVLDTVPAWKEIYGCNMHAGWKIKIEHSKGRYPFLEWDWETWLLFLEFIDIII